MPFNECFLGTGCSDGDALVVIDSWVTNVGVLDVCTGDNCWIGLTDYPTEGVWEWVQEGANSTYLNWNGGEPNNVGQCGEHCAHISACSIAGTIVYKQRKARKAEGPQSFPSAPMHSGAAEVQLVPAGAPAGRQVQV